MKHLSSHGSQPPYVVGLFCGLLSGLMCVVQWVLTDTDLANRLATLRAMQQRYPGIYDETDTVRGNEFYWLGVTAITTLAVLGICVVASFTAARASQHATDGMIAAGISAIVAGIFYYAATIIAVAASPDPAITRTILPCIVPFGIAFVVLLTPLAYAAANVGESYIGTLVSVLGWTA